MASEHAAGHSLMADLSDVENAIVSRITDILYPGGIMEASAVGVTCRIYRGWPAPAALNADLATGVVNVTVFPSATAEEVPDPYFDISYSHVVSAGLTGMVAGDSVTMGGVCGGNQIVGILVDGVPYIQKVMATDTADGVAANLAALIRRDRDVSLSHATFAVPGARSLEARVVTRGLVSRGARRQRHDIVISCWCSGALSRDLVGKMVDAGMMSRSFISLVDETKARLRYVSTHVYDQSQGANLYRRDVCYKCEYTTIHSEAAPVMVFGDIFNNRARSFA